MSFDVAQFLTGLTVEAPPAAPSPAPLVVVCEADETPIPYKPPEEWDAADRAVVEGYHGNGRIFTVTGAAPAGSVPGVPPGWTPDGWRRRLLGLADSCEPTAPERAAELRDQAAGN